MAQIYCSCHRVMDGMKCSDGTWVKYWPRHTHHPKHGCPAEPIPEETNR